MGVWRHACLTECVLLTDAQRYRPATLCQEQREGHMEPSSKSDRKTVLVVDDDPHVLVVVTAVLGDSEYDVLTAGSGLKALEEHELSRAISTYSFQISRCRK
jgi:hypothetical protein